MRHCVLFAMVATLCLVAGCAASSDEPAGTDRVDAGGGRGGGGGNSGECAPACRDGFVCVEGACVSACNPPCASGEVCRADGSCAVATDAGDDGGTSADAAHVDVGPDVAPDAEPTDVGGGDDTEQACVTATAEGRPVRDPIDIVWAVDTSGSMDQEAGTVERKLNDFSRAISSAGGDIRVVMVADNEDVCIPPPLSGAVGCPDTDSASYLHVRDKVSSGEVFADLINHYATYSSFLRDDAQLHFVAVTDDDDDDSWEEFQAQIEGSRGPFVFHSITSESASGGDSGLVPCVGTMGVGAAPGAEYRRLTDATGGYKGNLCADDWDALFDELVSLVVERSEVPCEYSLPSVDGGEVDPNRTNVYAVDDGGARSLVGQVDDEAACTPTGWYFDDPVDPSRLFLCDGSCGEAVSRVDLEFGCETVKQ